MKYSLSQHQKMVYSLSHAIMFIMIQDYYFAVPSSYPQNFMATASNSHSVTFSWDPPPPDQQNGIITQYFINITIANSGETFQESTAERSLSINTLQPFTTYLCVIAASTSTGIGPYSMVVTLTTPQDGMLLIALSLDHGHPEFQCEYIILLCM